MLVFTPSALYGRVGAVLSALIVVFCLIGLTMHKDFYARVRRRGFYYYYTNLSNLAVLLYFAVCAPLLYSRPALSALIPHAEFLLAMSIMLTFCVFHLLLFPAVRPQMTGRARTREFSILCWDNLLTHYVVPWLTFFYWLLCSPGKASLTWWDAPLFTLFPLAYLAFILLRARSGNCLPTEDSPYPYPFLDCGARGTAAVAKTCAKIFSVCLLGALGVLALVRLAFAAWGGGHALGLI